MTTDPKAELAALEGAVRLSDFWKRYGLPKSSVYQAAETGELETITTAQGHRLVPPAAALAYLTGAGDRASRVKGGAKLRQEAAAGGAA